MSSPVTEFIGKVVSFSTSEDTMVLKNIEFRSINSVDFVFGTIPKNTTKNGWADGKTAGIAWNRVLDFMIFDDEETYGKLLAKSEEN